MINLLTKDVVQKSYIRNLGKDHAKQFGVTREHYIAMGCTILHMVHVRTPALYTDNFRSLWKQ
eukprot:Awhi_evm1s13564